MCGNVVAKGVFMTVGLVLGFIWIILQLIGNRIQHAQLMKRNGTYNAFWVFGGLVLELVFMAKVISIIAVG